jgi:hypothetical protein
MEITSSLKNAGAVEVLLGVGFVAHAVALQRFRVLERRQRALAAEAVEYPEQHQVKLALVSIGEELLKRGAVGRATRFLLGVLFVNVLVVGLGIAAQVGQLIISELAFVLGRDTGIEGYFHS